MANPSNLKVRATGRATVNDQQATVLAELNKITTNLRILTAKLDADAGVTDTNYAALVTDSAVSGPAVIDVLM